MFYLTFFKKIFYKLYSFYKTNKNSYRFKNAVIMPNSSIDQNCVIGEYTYIGHNCFLTKAIIGRYCSIANNVSIGSGDHNLTRISTSSIFYQNPYEELTKKECLIGHDVWIGVDAIIKRGVKVGNGCVIGANSFVNKDIPDFAIAVGSPAKIIGYRFSPINIQKIKNSKWWEYSFNDAQKIFLTLEISLKEESKRSI